MRRPQVRSLENDRGEIDVPTLIDEMESLRQGTREVFESGWTLINNGADKAFTHLLGEIPCVVDVIRSETADGVKPIDSNADVTVAKTTTTITVTNNVGANRYFNVRAF